MVSEVKQCTRCGEIKDLSLFQRRKGNVCRQCWDKQSHQKTRSRIIQHKLFINDLKKDGCIICGYNKCMAALDWHHIDPDTKHKNISSAEISRMPIPRIMEEISKCVLLCANCHRELHDSPEQGDVARAIASLTKASIEKNKIAEGPGGPVPLPPPGLPSASIRSINF